MVFFAGVGTSWGGAAGGLRVRRDRRVEGTGVAAPDWALMSLLVATLTLGVKFHLFTVFGASPLPVVALTAVAFGGAGGA